MEGAKTSDDWRSTLTKDEREAMELKISDRLLKLKIRITSGSLYNPMSGQMEKLLLDTIASEMEEWMFNNLRSKKQYDTEYFSGPSTIVSKKFTALYKKVNWRADPNLELEKLEYGKELSYLLQSSNKGDVIERLRDVMDVDPIKVNVMISEFLFVSAKNREEYDNAFKGPLTPLMSSAIKSVLDAYEFTDFRWKTPDERQKRKRRKQKQERLHGIQREEEERLYQEERRIRHRQEQEEENDNLEQELARLARLDQEIKKREQERKKQQQEAARNQREREQREREQREREQRKHYWFIDKFNFYSMKIAKWVKKQLDTNTEIKSGKLVWKTTENKKFVPSNAILFTLNKGKEVIVDRFLIVLKQSLEGSSNITIRNIENSDAYHSAMNDMKTTLKCVERRERAKIERKRIISQAPINLTRGFVYEIKF